MKNISLLCLTIILFSCNNTNENPILNSESDSQSYKFYGKVISQDSVKNLELEKKSLMSTGIKTSKISGKIVETCSKKGCWMTLDTGKDTLFIKFRDYAFFVPTDSVEGKKAIIQLTAKYLMEQKFLTKYYFQKVREVFLISLKN